MEWMVLVVLVLGLPVGLAIWLIVRAVSARNEIERLERRLNLLELQLVAIRKENQQTPSAAEATAQPSPEPTEPIAAPVFQPEPEPIRPVPAPPTPIRVPPEIPSVPAFDVQPVEPEAVPVAAPPPIYTSAQSSPQEEAETQPVSDRENLPAINWEQFMGVKLFAWVGGLALFLGVAFFVKYSFDNNLISPALRVAIGFLSGLGLLVGGVVMSKRDYPALSQTLCATGVVILYAVTFACRSIYHFAFFGPIPTFLLMALITTTAFLLAVRLNAMVVAILGMLGGFLTPMLLSSGHDNPFGLFAYIAILDLGLILVALNKRWFFLAALSALGTIIMQIGWTASFFVRERYFEGNKIFIAFAVLLTFQILYLAGSWWARKRQESNSWLLGSVLGLAAVALGFSLVFLNFEPLAQRPLLVFGFVFLVDLIVAALVWLDNRLSVAHALAGLAVFGLLSFWTANSLKTDLLNHGLALCFVFAAIHSAFPIYLQKYRGVSSSSPVSQLFPPLALVLVLFPVFKLADLSFMVWPFIFLIDLMAIALAVVTASLLSVIAALLLTLAATGALIFKIPVTLTGLPTSMMLLGAFSVFFVGASVWLARKFRPEFSKTGTSSEGPLSLTQDIAEELPSLSAILPFLLLIMAALRLPMSNPSPVFGVALLLTVLLLGLARMFTMGWLPATALACVAALEYVWHFHRFSPASYTQPLAWYLLFLGIFTVYPFLFTEHFKEKKVPWATAALAGPLHFLLIYKVVCTVNPNNYMGLLPAAFALLPLIGLVVVLKKLPPDLPQRLTHLAWFGGVALFFITLIFPIQFERQWITIGWALEGAALLWLFHRLPHPGLRLTGLFLLVIAFVRLTFNPAVLDYHARAATPILNWYLYAYGIVTVCLYAGARLLSPPDYRVAGISTRAILASLGTVLAFLLLNIQIADYFGEPGSRLTFQFSGNFARDMTYSIAWALFALALLVFGIVKSSRGARLSAIGLLCVTLLKLFFHDLARLGQLYRIGALIGVAAIAMVASFAYQRFFAASKKKTAEPQPHETAPNP